MSRAAVLAGCLSFFGFQFLVPAGASAGLRVGAAVVDVSPPQLPVLVNGGFLSRTADRIHTPVNARAIVIDGGDERIAIVVVDSCMLPRPLLDEAKQLAAGRTEIAADRMLISATHTHSAPSCMGALGTDADPAYVSFLRHRLADAVVAAEDNLQPAEVGWGTGDAAGFTAVRRWVRRSDRIETDPFGNPTVQANMHAAKDREDVTGPSGPEDPELSMIAFRAAGSGRPLAVLANFSMHYFGDRAISADYFGLFCDGFADRIVGEPENGEKPPFVAVLSHGCSGDIWRRDYSVSPAARRDPTIAEYTGGLIDIAESIHKSIDYRADVELAMAESRMRLDYRVPDRQRLEWARRIVDEMGDRLPENRAEVYAREQLILHERQDTEIVLQAIQLGDIAIATTPNETYAITGLKLKAKSPLASTMVIELAGGGDGYIPPPAQHQLGGYNTWPARTAGLEVTAEPKITSACLRLLETVSGRRRRVYEQPSGPAADRLLELKPAAYWRLHEFEGPRAADHSGHGRDAIYESHVAYFLPGPDSPSFSPGDVNRCPHFAGGRLRGRFPELGPEYSVSFWLWNGMPSSARETTGWFFSRDHDQGRSAWGDHLGIGGTATEPGRLVFVHGDGPPALGATKLERWQWHHVTLVRRKNRVRVYLDDRPEPEIELTVDSGTMARVPSLFFGGRSDNRANFEGRLDEIAVFDRAIDPAAVR